MACGFIFILTGCIGPKDDRQALKEKIGQMLMVGFHGTGGFAAGNALRKDIASGNIAGVLLLSHNIKDRRQVQSLIKEIKSICCRYPLFIAIDQEGGSIGRLTGANGFEDFPSSREVAISYTPEEAYGLYLRMAKMLRKTGINLNLAPVVDLSLDPESPIIGKKQRSFSADPQVVAVFAAKFIAAHRRTGVLTAIKHYPGLGSAKSDPHKEFLDITDTYDQKELFPFSVLIKNGLADMVMNSHAVNFKADAKYPASLSEHYIAGELRKTGFTGVVISDDLQMAAISKRYSFADTVIHAVNAGNDILLFEQCFVQGRNVPEEAIRVIMQAVDDGRLKKSKIEASFKRIIKLKRKLAAQWLF